jgi:hypothetical protein
MLKKQILTLCALFTLVLSCSAKLYVDDLIAKAGYSLVSASSFYQ